VEAPGVTTGPSRKIGGGTHRCGNWRKTVTAGCTLSLSLRKTVREDRRRSSLGEQDPTRDGNWRKTVTAGCTLSLLEENRQGRPAALVARGIGSDV
jgi:hypothetical protein